MSLGPERTLSSYPVFGWLEIAARLEALGDSALAVDIFSAMNGRRLGDDAVVERTTTERGRVPVGLPE